MTKRFYKKTVKFKDTLLLLVLIIPIIFPNSFSADIKKRHLLLAKENHLIIS